MYRSFPETEHLPDHYPTGGFGGMVTKPWRERTRTSQELQIEIGGALSKIPGVRVISLTPPPLPGGGDFPVDLVVASTAEPQQRVDIATQLVAKAFASGLFTLRRHGPEVRPAAGRDGVRP